MVSFEINFRRNTNFREIALTIYINIYLSLSIYLPIKIFIYLSIYVLLYRDEIDIISVCKSELKIYLRREIDGYIVYLIVRLR